MDTYSLLREIADSWVLLAMCIFFLGVIVWAFRPGSTATYKSVSEIPLRDDLDDDGCADCPNQNSCKSIKDFVDV